MTSATRQWVEKAEADYEAAVILRRTRRSQTRDIVCFLLQQCVEKYLKARLVEASISFPRTHDLEQLLNLTLPAQPLWFVLNPAMRRLTNFAVDVRYPGRTATAAEMRGLMTETQKTRLMVRDSLGLK